MVLWSLQMGMMLLRDYTLNRIKHMPPMNDEKWWGYNWRTWLIPQIDGTLSMGKYANQYENVFALMRK